MIYSTDSWQQHTRQSRTGEHEQPQDDATKAPVHTPALARPCNAAPCCTSCTGNASPSSCLPSCLARRACRSDPETAQGRLDIAPGAIGLRPRLRPSQTSRCASGRLHDSGRTVGSTRASIPAATRSALHQATPVRRRSRRSPHASTHAAGHDDSVGSLGIKCRFFRCTGSLQCPSLPVLYSSTRTVAKTQRIPIRRMSELSLILDWIAVAHVAHDRSP